MTEKSVSVILALKDNLDVLSDVLNIWLSSVASYQSGAELVLVDRQKDLHSSIVEPIMDNYKNSGVRIVYFKGTKDLNLSEAYNYGLTFVEGNNVLFATGADYPNGKILDEYRPLLHYGDETIYVGKFEHVAAPYRHSVIANEFATYSPGYQDLSNCENPWDYCGQGNFVISWGVCKYLASKRTTKMLYQRPFSIQAKEDFESLIEFAIFASKNGYKFEEVPDASLFRTGDGPMNRRVRKVSKDSQYLTRKLGGSNAGVIKSGGSAK